MQEWYSPAELAELDLPGLPTSRSSVARHATNNQWGQSKYARARKGKGGGYEYHYKILPQSIQSLLTIRFLKCTAAPDETSLNDLFTGAHTIPEPPSSQAGELRRDAKLLILNFWDIFRSRRNEPITTSRHFFVVMYKNGKIEGIPDWVRGALRTANGKDRGLCVNTLIEWEKLRANHQFTELAGGYGNRKGKGVLDRAEGGDVATLIASVLVDRPHATADHIKDKVTDRFGNFLDVDGVQKPIPDIRSFQRWIRTWLDTHKEAVLKMTDPDAFKNKMKITGSNMNHWVKRPNQLWEIDASPADVLLTDGRYSIYAVVDIYTRRMLVSVSKTATTEAVLNLVRKAILLWGVPEILRTDNGSDFISYRFKQAMSALAIHQDITAPFSPEQKGTVERHIGTLQRGLMPLLPGFIGHNVADRSKIEARKSFAQRLGETDKDAFCVDLSHDDLTTIIDQWVATKYEHKIHGGLNKKTPFQMITEWTGPIRMLENERALDLLLSPLAGKDGMRVVTKHGIRVDRAAFIAPELIPDTRVLCRHDPEDMGRIYVYSHDGRDFICVAECPERLGVNPGEAVRAARAAQADRIKDELEPLKKEIANTKPRDMIDAILRVADQKCANVAEFPNPSETYTSDGLEAAADAAEPKAGPAPLTDEEIIAADQAWTEMHKTSENVVVLPNAQEKGTTIPNFADDADFVLWVRENPEVAGTGRVAYANQLLEESPTLRMQVLGNNDQVESNHIA